MIPSLRRHFNSTWTPAKYERFLRILADRFGEPTPFRHSETPCFLPEKLVRSASDAGRELVDQLLGNAAYLQASRAAIPDLFRTPNEDPFPLFVQADFGLDQDQNLKLVEIQGFPSLYCYQPTLSHAYRDAYELPGDLLTLPNGLADREYWAILQRAIVSTYEPERVALLELDPDNQKTRHDFYATRDMLGIPVVDARSVIKRGSRLFYKLGNKETPIERIFNRVIADEVARRGISLPFDFRDDLQVSWAGHPNWFFLISKFSLPFLQHATVPVSRFLGDSADVTDPENYVLKPLYSFAGLGVTVGPSHAQIDAIPPAERSNYILQRRVHFTPAIDTPEGPTKIEIRVMYVWLEQLTPINLVIRMGRGAQMGVDHNKGFRWVGASAAFIQKGLL